MEPNISAVVFHPSAHADLKLLGGSQNKYLAHEVVTRCMQLKFDPLPDESHDIVCCKKKGYEIRYLKREEFPSHRVLYAIDEEKGLVIVFGVMPRSVDYVIDSDFMRRVIGDYLTYFEMDGYVKG